MEKETKPKSKEVLIEELQELAKKQAAQAERLDAKPDAPKPKDAKKSDVAIPMDAMPESVEAEMRKFTRLSSRGQKEFKVGVTNSLAALTDKYGVSKKPGDVVNGLETAMIKAYCATFDLSPENLKELEAAMKYGNAKEGGSGFALSFGFRALTGWDSELIESLKGQKSLDFNSTEETVLERLSKHLYGSLMNDSVSKFTSTVNDDNFAEFKRVPLLMAKRLGLEDQFDEKSIVHSRDVVEAYRQFFGKYAARNRTGYLN